MPFQVGDVLQARGSENVNHVSVDCSEEVTSVAKGTLQGGREERREHLSGGGWDSGWGGAGKGLFPDTTNDPVAQRQHPDAAVATGHYTAPITEPHGVCRSTASGCGDGEVMLDHHCRASSGHLR